MTLSWVIKTRSWPSAASSQGGDFAVSDFGFVTQELNLTMKHTAESPLHHGWMARLDDGGAGFFPGPEARRPGSRGAIRRELVQVLDPGLDAALTWRQLASVCSAVEKLTSHVPTCVDSVE